ncbi:Interferon-induced, double-stranded RNA-activated protein kinase [Geodia barretti]|uniref:non-specific serine/threonine protein kinase n=1 Tax=Geodia barretti TaxID=519541 RepID=A0AA35XDE7_GEOBA|nr:Interferon-induced, double-stranded RNA-activated protein kinase [Geodia barretti]
MGLAESSTVEATDGVRSRRRDEEKEDPSLLNSTLPEQFASRFEVLEVVGKGSFGKVYKVRDKKTKAIYATKHQTYNDSNIKEVRIQAGVNDEQVVKIYDTITVEEKEMFIVMEYCEGGNLLQWIKRSRRHKLLNQTVILQMLFGICQVVYNCHVKKIIHRDIKPENILLDSRRRIKLGELLSENESVKKSESPFFSLPLQLILVLPEC